MRALLIVLDSVGVGHAPDAAKYWDEGADTLGHIYATTPGFSLPTLEACGLTQIRAMRGELPQSAINNQQSAMAFGRMRERSLGKDTTTGHWEIAGAPLDEPFATFEHFPDALVQAIERDAGVEFIGNYPRSGTTILDELGAEHVATGKPILYTSADSVMQIAAHEEVIPLDTLYALCRVARRHCDAYRIGRVIARPFIRETGNFQRTANRHDYSMLPPRTVLNALTEACIPVAGVGKIGDIFAGSGISDSHPTKSNADGMRVIEELWPGTNGLVFVNLVDFDMLFGHRRDVAGYANALIEFDRWLAEFLNQVNDDDLLLITADHGNDPTWHGTDHTREEVPILMKHGAIAASLGTRESFADVAATLAQFFKLPPWLVGTSFLRS